ncbi:MAG: histone [Candidatus Hodarchaeales archaeon]|jgi:histone H3/H4
MLGQSRVRKLLKDQGAQRIEKKAVQALIDEIVQFGTTISTLAIQEAKKAKRKTLKAEDIDNALRFCEQSKQKDDKMDFHPFFHHIWLLDEESGLPLISKSYSGLKFEDTIFSGLLLGIINLMREATGRELHHLVLGDLTVHLRKIDTVYVASICDTDAPETIDRLTALIGTNFIERYRDELHDQIKNIELFKEFETTLEEAVASSGMELPTTVAIQATSPLEAATLSRAAIEDFVTGAALKEDLQTALKVLREHPVFKKTES